jgi:tetratricopeptide (TPR) repeat protein
MPTAENSADQNANINEVTNDASKPTSKPDRTRRLRQPTKPAISTKTMSTLERIRLGLLLAVLAGVAFYAFRRYQWTRDTSAIYALLEMEDAATATERLRELETKWGRSGESSFLRARASRYLGDVEQSSLSINAARVFDYDTARLDHEQLLLDVQQTAPSIDGPTIEKVITSYQAAVDENLTALVRGFLRINNMAQASQVLGLWEKEYAESYRLKYMTGVAKLRINDFEGSSTSLKSAYEAEPNFIPLWLEMARMYWRELEPEKSYEFYDKYFQKRPDDGEAEAGRIEALVSMGQYEKVDEYFKSYKDVLDINGRARIFRAQAYEGLDQPEKVIETLEPLIKAWPNDLAANQMLAVAYQSLGNQELAAKHAETSRKSLEEQGKIAALRDRISKNFENPIDHAQLGHILLHVLSREEGIDELYIALSLDPTIRAAHEDMVQFAEVAGNARLAAEHKQAIEQIDAASGTTP